MEDMFMTAVATPDAARLVFAAVAGLILLLILIIKFKVHAMISILIGAVGIGLMAGMPLSDIIGSVNEGIGNTLKGIALLVGLGSMFGAILEESGGAQTLAVTMVRKFGDEKAAWALGITGLVVAMPVFFDAGLIILIPLAFSLAKRTKRSVLYYVIPLLAGLAVGHAFIPPTPGPVLVASMLGVDLGWVILIGIFCGIFAMIAAGPIWGSICGKKYMIEVPEHVAQQADIDESKLPKFGTIVGIILIPLVLIIANSVAKVVPALAGIQPVLAFLGEPFMALLLATIAAMYLLGTRHGYNNAQLEKIMTKSLEPTGMILLVTACGGVLRYMLQNSGLGDVIGNAVANASLPLVLVAFIVAALVRISVGSSTVAMTMAAGIISALPGVSARAGTSTQDAPASRTAACAVSNRISPGVMQTVPAGIGRSVSAACATENRMLPSAAVACFRLSPRSWAWLSRQLPAAVWGKHCRSTQSAWAYRAYTWAATA